VPNEESLRSERLSSLYHKSTSKAVHLRNDEQNMHIFIFCLLFSSKFFHFNTCQHFTHATRRPLRLMEFDNPRWRPVVILKNCDILATV